MEKEGPTDVLAFPMDELRPGLVNEEPEEGVLGDLVLCPRSPLVRVRPPGTARTPRSSCSPCTGSCTCGLRPRRARGHREMFGLQDERSPRAERAAPTRR